MKKTHIIHSSYLLFIMALAFIINDSIILSLLAMISSACLLALIFCSSKSKVAFCSKDFFILLAQLFILGMIRKSLISISSLTFISGIISVIYNTVFLSSLRAISARSASFITRTIGFALSFGIIALAIVDGIIAYTMQLGELASIGYLYLLILNYLPVIGYAVAKSFKVFSKRLILS